LAIVESLGKLAQVEATDVSWWTTTSRAILNYDGTWEDYASLWRTQPNVRTVVSFLARNIAQLGIKTYKRSGDAERTHVPSHPLARLLRKPNPWTTRFRLVYELVSDMAIYENALWLKVRDPASSTPWLIALPPEKVQPDGGDWFRCSHYKLTGRLGEYVVAADQLVHFRLPSPVDRRWGTAPLETLRRILAEDSAAGAYRESYWRNSARFETVLSHPGALSADASARLRADWEALYTGAANSGRTAILEEGMKVEPLSFNARDSQYLEVRKLSREEVAAAYHIPPPMVGVLDHATFSNITEQHRMLYQDTLGPWLAMISEEIELQLLPDLEAKPDDFYIEFNLEEKIRGSFEEQTTALVSSVGGPWMTRNEARALLNRPPVPGGDELIVPLNLGAPVKPGDATRTPPALGAASASVVAKFLARQKTSVLSAIATRGGFSPDAAGGTVRWRKELLDDLTLAGETIDPRFVLSLVGRTYDALAHAAKNGQEYGAVFDALITEATKGVE
jgi:HK97 family phage portal protein